MSYVSKLHYSTNYKIVNMAINFPKKVLKNKCVNIHDKQAVKVYIKIASKSESHGGGGSILPRSSLPPSSKVTSRPFF